MFSRILTVIVTVLAITAAVPAAKADNPLSQLGSLISNLTSKTDFDLASLEGTWNYSAPAVSLQGGNTLSKVGGALGTTGLESKLSPYYKRLGLDKAVITFGADSTFTIKLKKISLKGTVGRDANTPEGQVTFHFSALGKTNIGSVNAMVTKSATGDLTLTFDASRVISIVEKVASLSGNSSLQSLSKLLSSYDGIYAGARFKKGK